MKTDIAERRYKRLKTFLLVATISLPVWIVGIILSIVLPSGIRDIVGGIIAGSGGLGFLIGTIGSLVIFLRGRRKPT